MLEHYEREVFHHIPMTSAYGKYSDKHGFPRREIVQPALPDQLIRAAFMLTWQAGGTWQRNHSRSPPRYRRIRSRLPGHAH